MVRLLALIFDSQRNHRMKRIFASALVLSVLSFSVVGLVGCGETAKTESQTKVETPTGSVTETQTNKTTTTGDGAAGAPAAPK
jgi:hypothetical protein